MKRRTAGYSMIELLLVVTILGILISVGPTLMIQLQNFVLMTTARNDIERDARNSLDVINRFLRQAVSGTILIDTPASGGGPFSRITCTLGDGRTATFYQSGSSLIQKINNDTTVLTKNLGYIAFSFPRTDSPNIVSVALTMSKNIQQGKKKVLELTIQKVRVMN